MSPSRRATSSTRAPQTPSTSGTSDTARGGNGYTIPVVAVRVPAPLVETGFWGALAGTALLGVVDAPLALLVGAGVAIARHRRS